jgi:hypothetical protein
MNCGEVDAIKELVAKEIADTACTESLLRLYDQKLTDQVLSSWRDRLRHLVEPLADFVEGALLSFALERNYTSEELIKHDTEGPEVA